MLSPDEIKTIFPFYEDNEFLRNCAIAFTKIEACFLAHS
jgi:hypothetical protein